MLYLVTVKLPKNPEHNPRDKKTGPCPANGNLCTDVTGEHHTFTASLDDDLSAEDVRKIYQGLYDHITRIEIV